MMKYELRENHGIPAPLLALMAVAPGLSVANCYYTQPFLGSMSKEELLAFLEIVKPFVGQAAIRGIDY